MLISYIPRLLLILLQFTYTNTDHCCQGIAYSEDDTVGDTGGQQYESKTSNLVGIRSYNEIGKSCEEDGSCTTKEKRYILYEVNPGEGFNLRRDIFIRIAPLIKSLNKNSQSILWTLVLPPWTKIPHWRNTKQESKFPWSNFFQVDKILDYIPVIELSQFIEDYGLDNAIDVVYQLQHFPFKENDEWKEEIKSPASCTEQLGYKLYLGKKDLFKGYFWHEPIFAKHVECMSLRGQASTLVPFISQLNFKAIMLDKAEVILWDNYGGEEWWRARLGLKFALHLIKAAERFLTQNKLQKSSPSGEKNIGEYIGVHLRRKDFLYGRSQSVPSIEDVANHIFKIAQHTSIFNIYLATDAEPKESESLKSHMDKLTSAMKDEIHIFRYPCDSSLSDGECAIMDQILCSHSHQFVGSEDSTFTFRIFEEREILGFTPETTYNYLCKGGNKSCKKPTQWRLPQNLVVEAGD